MVKAAASGEAMSARGIGQNVKVIKDIPIFMCNSNYDWGEVNLIPKDSPDDESMARRVLLLSFDKKVPEGKRDPELVDKLLLEKEGIFQWIVRGYRRLKRDKWKINDSLFGRVDKVRKMANGKVAINGKYVHGSIIEYINFKGISTIMDEKHSNAILLSSSDIYENYLSFCKSNGLLSVTSCHKFSLDFGNYGFSKRVGFGANNCNGYVMYWAEPHNTMIFKASVPSVEKILDMDALLEENEEEEDL
jgi:phage/plasmid-associated DNA primase